MQYSVLNYLENGALRKCPDGIAATCGAESVTFQELDIRARRLASSLCCQLKAMNRPIAVFLPKGINTIAADLAVLYSGNCYSNLDVKSPQPRIKAIVDNLQPSVVVATKDDAATILSMGVERGRLFLIDDPSNTAHVDEKELLRRRNLAIDTDPVCIVNTSGSTGVPKSVVMNHRNIIDFIDWTLRVFPFNEDDVIGSLSPFYFDIYTLELWVAMATGARISVIPESLAAFPVKLVEHLRSVGATFLFWVPTIMVNIANLGLLEKFRISSLKRVFFAGEVFPTKQFNRWRRNLPHTQFVNLYGPIEITVDCTYFIVDRDFSDNEPLPIGVPCQNTEILILNEANQPTRGNEVGELCVRGSSLAMGYWNNPERTNAVFVQNPLNSNYPDRIYRTGDLAYWNANGEVMFVGRTDYQIKHLGYRIELGEIENAVTSLAEIEAACALYDAEQQQIRLVFVASETLSVRELRQKLARLIPKYMLPGSFHRLSTMPRNANGKIDRMTLLTNCPPCE